MGASRLDLANLDYCRTYSGCGKSEVNQRKIKLKRPD